jgi:hypothetical protein
VDLLLFGNPCFYCFFDGASQVALFSAEPLDGLEPKLLFQLIREYHAYSTHFQSPTFIRVFVHDSHVSEVFPISELPDATLHVYFCCYHFHSPYSLIHIIYYIHTHL